eukprot:GILK01002897.1.p1 GENE.GILK01002897.1~~GILK01002897.1.p1  ORF type:complete len:630 (-),score=93.02 GILK01002897.1:76-1785(-)
MDILRWNGWGYKDTEFRVNSDGCVELTGDRYLFSGKVLPNFRPWAEKEIGLNMDNQVTGQEACPVPAPRRNEEFLRAVSKACKRLSFEDGERLFHGHGHSCQEIYTLRFSSFDRVPDVVVYPSKHEDVEVIVAAAHAHNVVLIPFGGGTNVSQALLCPPHEERMIVSLDMSEMNRIKWVDRDNLLACIEAGAIGKEMEKELNKFGVCLGHEPDSFEFSSLGGWVATRASGMKKNVYGNIEDIVIKIKFVTPTGTLEKNTQVPRMSVGPDVNQFILGSEGTLGVVTECVVRVRPLPKVRKYGSIVFPDFDSGAAYMFAIGKKRWQPVSIRLMDNVQFQLGMSLKPATDSAAKALIDKAKKYFVTKIRGFSPDRMTAVTLMFEGEPDDVTAQEKRIYGLCSKFGGLNGGPENGERGYFLTYMIAYLRDYAFQYGFIAESFETSVPWNNVLAVCENTKERIRRSCEQKGVPTAPLVSCRITQLYDTGACVYFYFGFIYLGIKADPVQLFSEIEEEAREEILANGGSVSHHHGVGKLRKRYYVPAVSETGARMLQGIKQIVDPKNIFANGNIL